MADTREILLKLLGKETVSDAAGKAARGLKGMGDAAEKAAKDAGKLDARIADVAKTAALLRGQIAQTGDVTLFKDLGKSERELAKLTGIRKSLSDAGADAATGFAARFSARIGPLIAQAPVSGPLVGVIAAAAPAVGAAMSAAVLGGLTGGVVAAGVKIALGDARVKAEAEEFTSDISRMFGRAAASFAPATLNAMDIIRDDLDEMEGDFRRLFDQAAVYVAPLARSFGNLASEAIPGMVDGLKDASPVIYELEQGAGKVGEAIGSAMKSIGDGAAGAGLLVGDMLSSIALGIKGTGQALSALSTLYAAIKLGTSFDKQATMNEMALGKAAAAEYQAELDKVVESLRNGGTAATNTASSLSSLRTIMDEFSNAATTAFNAETRFGEIMDELTVKQANHGAGIDSNTKKGQENRDMLARLAEQTGQSAEKMAAMAGGQTKANQIMSQGYTRFMALADSMGISKKEAHNLAVQLHLIPPAKNIKINVDSGEAERRAKAVRDVVNGIRSKNIHIGVWWTSKGDLKVPGGTLVKDRWGGTHVPMAAGGTMTAGVYKASNPPLIRFAEPETGGEAYIPRRGNRSRSMGILSQAAGWYGAGVVDRKQAARTSQPQPGGQTTVVVNAGVVGSRAELSNWLTQAVDDLRRRGRL